MEMLFIGAQFMCFVREGTHEINA